MNNDIALLDALLRDYEHAGGGVRELNQRLKRATTSTEFEQIAAEAHRRSTVDQVPPSIEMAYQVLGALARRRIAEKEDVHHG